MTAKDERSQKWENFFSMCLRKRLGRDEFIKLFKAMNAKEKSRGQLLMTALLYPEVENSPVTFVDPRMLQYVEILLDQGQVSLEDCLDSMFVSFKSHHESVHGNASLVGRSKEAAIVQVLIDEIVEKAQPKSKIGAISQSQSLIAWLSIFKDPVEDAHLLTQPLLNLYSLTGQLTSSIISNMSLNGILDAKVPKEIKDLFRSSLPSFITSLSQIDIQTANNLDYQQKQFGLQEPASVTLEMDGVLEQADLPSLAFQDSVLDGPTVNTRAGLYVYLNALLAGRPICDDALMIDFLNTRYNGDIANLTTDLITASFDVLANAINRTEAAASITILRSFLVNKIPTILTYYSTMIFGPMSLEVCITQALNHIGPAAFPSFTQQFDLLGTSGMLSEARQDFLFACALHQLIPEASIEGLLGDVPMQSLPESGRYIKSDLVAQCRANMGRLEDLIGELENMDGNAGEIVGTLVEFIQSLCATKDTISLKTICNSLSKKVQSLDVIMLFTQPIIFLQPLCQLLDHWQDQDDQGEPQPIYDEFGSIFLFVLIVRHHFNLKEYDLSIGSTGSFMAKYLRNCNTSKNIADANEKEKAMLGSWITGLFDTEGISDELMSSCSPSDFHLLVPTLFDQSLKACQLGKLGLDTLKGGFEYLLEPFLLPSLISGLGWFTLRLWETDIVAPQLEYLLPVLQSLIKPPSLSSDSSTLHEAILSVITKPLQRSLIYVQNLHPRRADTDPLLETLKKKVQPTRTDSASHAELESWSTTSNGGILASIRHTVQSLTLWSTSMGNLDATASPSSYTHRLVIAGSRVLGAKTVLNTLLDEILSDGNTITTLDPEGALSSPSQDLVLDIVTCLIAAPTAADPSSIFPLLYHSTASSTTAPPKQHQLSLPSALDLLSTEAYALSKSNLPRAETIIRLHRRVSAATVRSAANEADMAAADVNMNVAIAENADMHMLDAAAAAGTLGNVGNLDGTGPLDDVSNIDATSALNSAGLPDLSDLGAGDVGSLMSGIEAGASHSGNAGSGTGDQGGLELDNVVAEVMGEMESEDFLNSGVVDFDDLGL